MRERDVLRQLAEQQREITVLRRALERALHWVPDGEDRRRMLELVYRETEVLWVGRPGQLGPIEEG